MKHKNNMLYVVTHQSVVWVETQNKNVIVCIFCLFLFVFVCLFSNKKISILAFISNIVYKNLVM